MQADLVKLIPSGWDIIGTIGLWAAVVVALVIELVDNHKRNQLEEKRDRQSEAKSLAQARLVLPPDASHPGFDISEERGGKVMKFDVTNLGERPILELIVDLSDNTQWLMRTGVQVLPAGESVTLVVHEDDFPSPYAGWRIRWIDADGKRWVRADHKKPP